MNSTTGMLKELSDSDYTALRKDLLRDKGNDRQRKFLADVRDSSSFLNYFEAVPTIGATDPVLLPNPMTENEFKDPPADTEHDLYTAWSSVTSATACRSAFWANLTLEHIRKKRIESVYLAANGGNLSGGAERVDSVLQDNTARGVQRIDSCVRTVLRRLGGLPEVRGNRSVYVDCPFARAWWRERLVEQAAGGDAQLTNRIRRALRIHQTYWEKLIDRIVCRNSTFGSANIRDAFVRALAQFIEANPDSELKIPAGLQRICRRVTAYQGSRELSVLGNTELDALMTAVVSAA